MRESGARWQVQRAVWRSRRRCSLRRVTRSLGLVEAPARSGGAAVSAAAPLPGPAAPLATAAPPPEWEYVPEGFERGAKGWDVQAISDAYREKWPSYLAAIEGPKPLGVYHEVVSGEAVTAEDHSAHNMLVSYGYVLALAARQREQISVLDWGGGIGHYLPLSRALLPGVEIDYHCKDVPVLASMGGSCSPKPASTTTTPPWSAATTSCSQVARCSIRPTGGRPWPRWPTRPRGCST